MTGPAMSRLPLAVEAQLRRHCEAQYPDEACGALFGQGDGTLAPWVVTELSEAPNEHGDDHKRRYLIPPDFQLQAERHAQATDQDVLGYYHSHPDHPAQPSEYDRVHAWHGYLYLICAVHQGRSLDLNGFALVEPGGAFAAVEVQDPPPALR
jgi:proteasome lid subunit RPN8/RPN11